MDENKIEELLRKAPGVKAPAGLLARLQGEVRLPSAETKRFTQADARPWLRRWMPALAFGMLILGCFVVVGVQTGTLAGLRRQNAELRAATQKLEQLRSENAEYQRLAAQTRELERLRQDNADVERLRKEVTQLRAQADEAEKLRAENQELRTENAYNLTPKAQGITSTEEARAKAEKIACASNLKQIGMAARVWAQENGNMMPSNFLCMSNGLNNWKILHCPSDTNRTLSSWADVAAGDVSYQLLAPGISDAENPATVAAMCPIHHNYLFIDGSVRFLGPEVEQRLKVINGRTVPMP